MKNQFTQIWFHASCHDGLTAASIALRSNPDAKCVGVRYQEDPPVYSNTDHILIVDFSYPRQVLLDLAKEVQEVVVLDHHKTAEADLKNLSAYNLDIRFDAHKCGASMAWHYFQSSSVWCPHGLEMIADRDLWLKRWPEETAAFTAGLGLIPEDRRVPGDHWYRAVMENWAETTEQGRIVVQYQRNLIASLLKNAIPCFDSSGLNVVELNSPILQSDLGEALLAAHPSADYADIWWQGADETMQHSLRSRPGSNIDVSAIAKSFGGGGHKHAAGYKEG